MQLFLLIPKHSHPIVLLIHVLHQLTQIAKTLCAFLALVREIGHRFSIGMTSTIRQHRIAPTRVSLHVIINLPTRIVSAQTSAATPTLDMLNSIRGRSEPHISTYWAAKLARTMDLHVHVQIILIGELTTTFPAYKFGSVEDVVTNTIGATRIAFAFVPLVVGVPVIIQSFIATSAFPVHHD